jgi:hypothetical protein
VVTMLGLIREVKLHASLLLAMCCAVSLFIPSGSEAACIFALLSTFLVILDYIMSKSYQLLTHWRSLPLAAIMIIASIITVTFSAKGARMEQTDRLALAIIILLIALITLCLITLLPVPTLPPLKGPFKRVGTYSFHIPVTLPDTAQLYRDEKSYELTVQCWFPISHDLTLMDKIRKMCGLHIHSSLWTSGHPDYQQDEISKLMAYTAENSSLPSILFRHISLVQSNSEYVADIANISLHNLLSSEDGRFPIALYSHGMYSWRQLSSTSFEMLASNGFVVFSVDHRPSAMMARPHVAQKERADVSFDYPLPGHIRAGSPEEREYYIGEFLNCSISLLNCACCDKCR